MRIVDDVAIAGHDAELHVEDPRLPWNDPRSAFWGGGWLLPPYRNLAEHTALVWMRVEPDRVLGYGLTPAGPALALRRWRVDAGPRDTLAHDVIDDLENLHKKGILHRRIRADAVAFDGTRWRLIHLRHALLDGTGPPLESDPAWDGELAGARAGSAAADWVALARVLVEIDAGMPPEQRAIVLALSQGYRWEVPLAALRGERMLPTVEPHVSLADWAWGEFVDEAIARGLPRLAVERIDETADRVRPTQLRGAVARLLVAAARRGGEWWAALGAACQIMRDTMHSDRDTLDRQVQECLKRAPPSAWRGAVLNEDSGAVAMCRRGRVSTAARTARTPGERAVAAWHRGDIPSVLDELGRTDAADYAAWRVAASIRILLHPELLDAECAQHALPDALDATCALLAAKGNPHRVRAAATEVGGTLADRMQLISALIAASAADAARNAAALAEAGEMDAIVAAVLSGAPGPHGALASTWAASIAPESPPRSDKAIVNLLRSPLDHGAWAALSAALAASRPDLLVAGAEVALEERIPGVTATMLSFLLLRGRLHDAHGVARAVSQAEDPSPGDLLLAFASTQAAGDSAAASLLAARLQEADPADATTWLARAVVAVSNGETARALALLDTADALGARVEPVRAIRRLLPED